MPPKMPTRAPKARTKPVPKPPSFAGGVKHANLESKEPPAEPRQLKHYAMPMRDAHTPAWQAVLRDQGFPARVLVLDFETYFDDTYSMGRKATSKSMVEYIMDEQFEVLCLSVLPMYAPFVDYTQQAHCWQGEEAVERYLRAMQAEYGDDLEGVTVVIQNAAFDASILAWRYGIRPRYLIDTLALARHWNSRQPNDLDTLAKQFELPEKGDTKEFKGMTRRQRFAIPKGRKKGPKQPRRVLVMTEEQEAKLAEYANNDVLREWEVFTLLLPKLSNPGTELRLMRHTLDLYVNPTLEVDEAKAGEIIEEMEAELQRLIEPSGLTTDQIGSLEWDEHMVEALEAAGEDANPYKKKAGNCKRGWKIAASKSEDKNTRELLENHPDQRVHELMQARIALDSWPNHISRVRRIVAQSKPHGKLPVPLKYHGAHTGRWSGGERINLQNLGSRGHPLVNSIRELLVAPEGHTLVIVDASQIEARVLAWVAKQEDLIEKFAADEEIYCGFAAKVLGWPVRKPKKTGIPAVEARHKWARNSVGKVGVLGCGYGMGASKAIDYSGGALDAAMAERVVKTYREENDRIVQFWKDIEAAFVYTARYQKPCRLRELKFESRPDADVVIVLPNGRELKYQNVRIKKYTHWPYQEILLYNKLERKWAHIWGGHLTENVVQAMSRDILAEAMLRLEDQGHKTVHHIHDELVMLTEIESAEGVLALSIKELSRRPTWGPDLPLNAEGVVSNRYGGH